MEQLLLHLFGDYVAQSDWMARNKTKAMWPALCHAAVYSLPFLLIGSGTAVLVIFGGHLVIDRFRLARYVVWMKNWLGPGHRPWPECSTTGMPKDTPEWLAVWIRIAVDNTIHLVWNYAALRWL
jgi:hypothetical protein